MTAWKEYDFAAHWVAVRGLTGADGEPLPELIGDEAYRLINEDTDAFRERVRAFAYAISMTE